LFVGFLFLYAMFRSTAHIRTGIKNLKRNVGESWAYKLRSLSGCISFLLHFKLEKRFVQAQATLYVFQCFCLCYLPRCPSKCTVSDPTMQSVLRYDFLCLITGETIRAQHARKYDLEDYRGSTWI